MAIDLREGDIVASKRDRIAYVVTAVYGDRVTAVRTVDITNPAEFVRVLHPHEHAGGDRFKEIGVVENEKDKR